MNETEVKQKSGSVQRLNCWELTKLITLSSAYDRLSKEPMREIAWKTRFWGIKMKCRPLKRNKHHFIKRILKATVDFGFQGRLQDVKSGAVVASEASQRFEILLYEGELKSKGIDPRDF